MICYIAEELAWATIAWVFFAITTRKGTDAVSLLCTYAAAMTAAFDSILLLLLLLEAIVMDNPGAGLAVLLAFYNSVQSLLFC